MDLEPAQFPQTRWSLISVIRGQPGSEASQALETLCHSYWYPLYMFARKSGLQEMDAKDVVQDTFARLLQKDRLLQASPLRGKMRTFLLTVLKNVILERQRRESAAKRGGKFVFESISMDDAEERFLEHQIQRGGTAPEAEYDRQWAREIFHSALQKLKQSCLTSGKRRLFEALEPAILGEESWPGYPAVAAALGMTENAVRVSLSRFRDKLRLLLAEEVKETVVDTADSADELAYLVHCLSIQK